MCAKLRRELQYYIEHQDELVEKYDGQYIVLAGDKIEGAFDTELEALRFARSELEPGSYIVKQVKPGRESYSQTFHTRVSFV